MARKTPQEKKRLSYLKERRNTFPRNLKAARKVVPMYKRKVNRQNRRRVHQIVAGAVGVRDAAVEEVMDVSTLHRPPKSWRKFPDMQLGEIVDMKLAWRARAGIADRARIALKRRRIRKRTRGRIRKYLLWIPPVGYGPWLEEDERC
jgi:hypothetical protein